MHLKKRFIWFVFYICILAAVLVTSFSITSLSYFNQKKIVESAILGFSSILFLCFLYKKQIVRLRSSVWIGLTIILIIGTVSSALAPLPQWAFLQVGWYLLIGQLLFLCSYLYQEDKEHYIKVVLIGLIVLCILYLTRVYADYITGLFNDNWTTWPEQNRIELRKNGVLLNPSAYLGFNHVRFFNHIQTWTLPLLAFAYLYFKDRIIPGLQYLLLFFISSWWMLVFAADARGTMVASTLGLLSIVVLFRKRCIPFAKVYLLTAAAGLVLYLSLFLLPQNGGREILSRFGDSGRLDVWWFTIEQIMKHPFLGLGPMHFSYMGINPPWSTPHNLILQTAAEWGIPAVILATVLVTTGLVKFIKQSLHFPANEMDPRRLIWRIALIASITAALAHSMVSGIFNSSLSQLLFTIVGGAIIGEYFLCSNRKLFRARTKTSLAAVAIIGLLGINTVFVAYKVASDIPHLDERKREFFEKFDTPFKLYPRFWHQGMIYEDIDDLNKDESQHN
ncbi:O-antigen ligase family protein [Halalkalibaculum sp. DA384]|uniref:O-antigen ligase family protein n=1 Tax=Halalkalibaculum sp. DA384 TaxID=3373606 RepID=UPI0037553F8F